jgi:S1-C subfamily serine protease
MPSYEEYGFPARPRRYREPARIWPAVVALLFLLALGGVAVWYFGFHRHRDLHNPEEGLRPVTQRGDRDAIEKERIQVFKTISPSVVNVDTLRIQRRGYLGISERALGTGSGFVWDTEGRIVTNFHVVQDTVQVTDDGNVSIKPSATVRVTLADQTSWNARLVGVAPDNDLAVLQIDAPADALKAIPVGSSSDLEVGQTAFAIGNPFGQTLTFTQGIVSALDREIQSVTDQPITGVIQTDAPLNPGNSGGPLLDREGRLIGVNTAITSPTGGSVGIGYAIPVDTVNQVVTQLIRNGRPPKPALGIVLLRDQDTRALGFEKGVMIAEVRPGTAAAKAGLRGFHTDQASGRQLPGDLITAVNGQSVNSIDEMRKVMSKVHVHDTITLTIQRGEETRELKVTLEGI